jgi:hypothetical protein
MNPNPNPNPDPAARPGVSPQNLYDHEAAVFEEMERASDEYRLGTLRNLLAERQQAKTAALAARTGVPTTLGAPVPAGPPEATEFPPGEPSRFRRPGERELPPAEVGPAPEGPGEAVALPPPAASGAGPTPGAAPAPETAPADREAGEDRARRLVREAGDVIVTWPDGTVVNPEGQPPAAPPQRPPGPPKH